MILAQRKLLHWTIYRLIWLMIRNLETLVCGIKMMDKTIKTEKSCSIWDVSELVVLNLRHLIYLAAINAMVKILLMF